MWKTIANYLGAITIVVMAGCSRSEEDIGQATVRPAKLVTVEAATNQRKLTFPAVIRATQSAELTFQVSGEIRKLNVLEGDEVEEGTIIAQLDQRDARNRLAQATAEYNNAKSEFERAERLFAEDAISRSVLDTRRTQQDIARASLDTSRKALSDTVLKAPFSGGVSRVLGKQFQNIQAKEAIAVLQSTQVEAVVNVPGTIIARIPQLQPVGTRVVLDAAPDAEIFAEFKEASGQADESTQTYEISFTFQPPEELLILPGMTASVETDFVFRGAKDIVPDGIAVPLSAILAEGDNTFVWVVEPQTMTLTKRQVSVSDDVEENVTVTEGLSDNEMIVAAGVSFFHEGMKVRAWSPE